MKKIYASYRFSILIIACILGLSGKASATHLYGADFFYTYVSGNTYNITLVIYGDCSGASFPSLAGATAQVQVLNGSSLFTTINLVNQAPTSGTEVTPVCAAQLSNTSCVSTTGTIPGVKKFTYSNTVTLSGASANWKFRFTGTMSTASAGRSNTLTNVVSGSITALEATLNNVGGPNSSPTYTTIPTPFFCINKAANYNPGTVDADGDNLSYALVTGLNGIGGFVTYVTPYTATAPLAVSTGTFSFNTSTGQLGFTPNLAQRSLVVNQVSEFRGTTLVGTSMREMTFVVLSSCSNNPPSGSMSNPSNGSIVDTVTFKACRSSGTVAFNINPTDPDLDVINVSASGIPAGATFTITNNNTTAPTGSFSWNLAGVPPGNYNFFITYTDNGCPLSSKQTMAYTIIVLPDPAITYALVTPATCVKKAVFNMTPSGTPSPWTISIYQSSSLVHTFPGLTGTQQDSLYPGIYIFRVTNANGCFKDTNIVIAPPPAIIPSVSMVQPVCNGGNDGSITVTATGGLPNYYYAIDAGAYSSNNVFTNLAAGTYTLHIRDSNQCVKDTIVNLSQPTAINANITFVQPPCNYFTSGVITVNAYNGVAPYQYALGTGPFSSTNTYSGLSAGSYLIHIKDANNCTKDTLFVLKDSIYVHVNATITNILCNGDNTGAVLLTAFGGTSPYQYKLGTGSLGSSGNFPNLPAGTYNFHIEDVRQCYLDTVITLTQPSPITSTSVVTNVQCYNMSNGGITTTASGGVSPYTYAIGTGAYSSTNVFNGLPAGTYTIHIKDANNCIKDTSITITQPTLLQITNVAMVMPTCNAFTDGTFTVTATGGVTPYTYAVGSGSYGSSNVLTGLAAGTYTLHVKDANNCIKDTVVTMAEPTRIIPTALVKRSTCSPLNNGSVTLSATGGIPSYQYAVGSGGYSTNPVFTGLAANLYIFHILDNHGCTKDTAITIDDSLKVTATLAVSDVKCFNESTGSITVTAAGGVSPYTYAVGTGSFGTSNILIGLPVGTYVVHVKDNIGCTKDTTPVNIAQPTIIAPAYGIQMPACHGYSNGSITFFPSGGTPTYSYAVGTGAYSTNATISNLAAGTYTFHIKDANSCVRDTVIDISEPAALAFTMTTTDVLCNGEKTGSITVNATGGTPAYTYSVAFAAFQAANPIKGLGAGAQYVRVRDNNGCIKDTTVVISQPAPFYIKSLNITNPTCEGYADGAVNITANGGVAPYKYGTSPTSLGSSGSFTQLTEGQYTFYVKDDNNCEKDTTVKLIGYPHIVIEDAAVEDVSCFGYANGIITLDVTGGVPPLKYKVNNEIFQDLNIIKNLKAGSYTVTVSDSKNCIKDTIVSVNSPEELIVSLIATPNDCEGYDNGGVINADVKGGTEPYNYLWSTAGNSSKLAGMPNGKYAVYVSDAHECADTAVTEVKYDNCCKPFIPDAFTPNGDGRNDKMHILFKGDFKLITFAIYNRFGQKVFETSNMSDGWDGQWKGVPQDLGTYNYYAKGICGNAGVNEVEYKGTITLIR